MHCLKVAVHVPPAIGCEMPEVQNGKVYELQSTYRAGELLQFDCDAGYAAEDSYEAQCQPGGTWDPPVLRCERGECGCPLVALPVDAPCRQEQHVQAEPFCNGLYPITAVTPFPFKAFCLPVAVQPCPMPPEIPNGSHNGQGNAFFTMGTSVTYTCDPGYYLVGNAIVFCKASGNWSQPGPRCIPCEPPPDIPNGKHTGKLLDEFLFGTAVTYTCNPGYPLHGEPSIYCTTLDGKNGAWSGPPPLCGGRVECAELYRNQTIFPVGKMVEYMCRPGYTQHIGMLPVITCLENRTWSVPLEFCKSMSWKG
uniref:Uncharacterized protein n=1 Tax=Melopsittacus undulatus TaxID=13146 RepID=A0A8C6JQK9_MELUD